MESPRIDILKNTQASWRELVGYIWVASKGVRARVVLVCLLGIVRVGMSLGFVWVSKLLIDAASDPSQQAKEIWTLAIVMIGVMLTEMVLAQVTFYVRNLTKIHLALRLRHGLYNSVLYDDPYATSRKHSGDIMSRVLGDVESVVTTIVETLPSGVMMLAQLGAACWLLFRMNPTLVLCAVLITPVSLLFSKLFFKKVRRVNAAIRDMDAQVQTNLQEGLQHRVVVQTLECATEMMRRFDSLQDALYEKNRQKQMVGVYSRVVMRTGFIAGYLIAFIWGVFELNAGTITFGIMTAFLQLMGRIQGPISGLAALAPSLVDTTTAVDRLIELQKGNDRVDITPMAMQGEIGVRFTNVSFRYGEDQREVLKRFSHDFRPGSKTVIVGETGVGKSTLTKIILALLHPTEGSVSLYNGKESIPVSAQTRCNMVYVPCGNSLLAGSIRDNLLLGNPDASEEQLREVLHIAVAEFVYDLPLGLDTMCGELGSRLSEGQSQRIAIARSLLRRGNLFVLDEFNSSLDTETSSCVCRRLIESRPHATMIFISHRSELVEMCDEVLRLQ